MKRLLSLVMTLSMLMCMMGSAFAEGELTEQWKTLGDIITLETPYSMSSYDDNFYHYAFEYEGVPYAAIAEFTEEAAEALEAVDFFADDREEQIAAILAPMPIIAVDNLAAAMYTDEELAKWVGKTGQDLLDEGWTLDGYGYSDDFVSFTVSYGLGAYEIEASNVTGEEIDEDEDAAFAKAIIDTIKYVSISSHYYDSSDDEWDMDEDGAIDVDFEMSEDEQELLSSLFSLFVTEEGEEKGEMSEEEVTELFSVLMSLFANSEVEMDVETESDGDESELLSSILALFENEEAEKSEDAENSEDASAVLTEIFSMLLANEEEHEEKAEGEDEESIDAEALLNMFLELLQSEQEETEQAK